MDDYMIKLWYYQIGIDKKKKVIMRIRNRDTLLGTILFSVTF